MDTIDTVQKHELPPTNQKRMVAFINHFIVSTVTFLNKFASDCETRFVKYEQKIQNLEASLMIVEAKLASIEVLKQPGNTAAIEDNGKQSDSSPSASVTTEAVEAKPVEDKESQPDAAATVRDTKYDPYFKMLLFGVPLGAVKNKITTDGLDPGYIDQFI